MEPAAAAAAAAVGAETLERAQARHRRELKDLQGRITNKKKNATKKTRKGVNDECAEMERQTRERHVAELAALAGGGSGTTADAGGGNDRDDDDENNRSGELEEAARKLSIGSTNEAEKKPPQPQQPQQHQQQQEGGKKRNRQKERLARRAAEQEAASARAEEEASSMTDRRALESSYMKKAFAANDLVEKDIEPDGHCLFSAVADQLAHNAIPVRTPFAAAARTSASSSTTEPAYRVVRRAAAAFMADNADDFAPFLEEELDAYVARVRDTAEWGGQLELTALARRYGAEIRVIQDGRTERIGEEEGKVTGKTLWLAYYRHGYGLGEHYNSLRRKTTPSRPADT
ncbi:Ubiquitinyl hydrolase 1 [Purpureocillium takamizusanense]|uniref:Ubiquitinyl hydrolase 1 n=1 Tax=Purpureocillium takamizusanense TaxID=2060973 RepID=A0A9Q8QJB7_9HYPO|nr:Ubiquitinyl hydrolase 1 [Purpureocillium takamizusanense]UNI20755.1 Ubiquitinyl hydrolase 1 [Purpureocillium takamizusanense]